MILRDVLLCIILITIMTLLPTMVNASTTMRSRNGVRATLAAGIIMLLVVASLFGRSDGFGVDTVAYSELLGHYCRGLSSDDLDRSYQFSLLLINAGMLGACNVSWLPGAWALIISALLLCLPVPWPIRLRYAALLLFSIIGIELTTNALRQGLSMAVLMLSVALWRHNRLGALLVAIAAAILHPSTALVLLALALSTLAWRWFWLGFIIAISLVIYFIHSGSEPSLLRPLLFEIQKYMAHEADELWVRVLAFFSVLGALLAPLLGAVHGRRYTVLSNYAYTIALRIGLCSLPFLVLPYFGYRIIYGLYPIILYFTLMIDPRDGVRIGRHFALLFAFNALLLLTWAHGSTYMRMVPFFE